MKHSLLALTLLASVASAADNLPPPPKDAIVLTDCWPKEAGGSGINFTRTMVPGKGAIFTWWGCALGGPSRGFAARSPYTYHELKSKALLPQLQRMYVESGFARDADTFLRDEINAQLAATKP